MKRWLWLVLAALAAAAGWWWWRRRRAAGAAPEVRSDRPATVTPPRPVVAGVPLINYGSSSVGKVVPSVVDNAADDGDDGLFRGG